jgi:hypothetical protein
MVLVELLKHAGVGGSVVLVAMALMTLLHGHSALQMLSTASVYAKVTGVVGFLLVLFASGLVPGVTFTVDLAVLGETVRWLWGVVPKGVIPSP